MSGEHFHVHGPHDHAVEHAAEHAEHDILAGRIAVTTAILATLAAIFSYVAGATQSAAVLHKNDAAIQKTEAANRWAHFQAKSTRESVAEVALLSAAPATHAALEAEVARYRAEKAEIEEQARQLEKEAAAWDRRSAAALHEHHRWAQATTALQMAIATAAIALVTRRRWLHAVVFAFAAVGVAIGGLALAHL